MISRLEQVVTRQNKAIDDSAVPCMRAARVSSAARSDEQVEAGHHSSVLGAVSEVNLDRNVLVHVRGAEHKGLVEGRLGSGDDHASQGMVREGTSGRKLSVISHDDLRAARRIVLQGSDVDMVSVSNAARTNVHGDRWATRLATRSPTSCGKNCLALRSEKTGTTADMRGFSYEPSGSRGRPSVSRCCKGNVDLATVEALSRFFDARTRASRGACAAAVSPAALSPSATKQGMRLQ